MPAPLRKLLIHVGGAAGFACDFDTGRLLPRAARLQGPLASALLGVCACRAPLGSAAREGRLTGTACRSCQAALSDYLLTDDHHSEAVRHQLRTPLLAILSFRSGAVFSRQQIDAMRLLIHRHGARAARG